MPRPRPTRLPIAPAAIARAAILGLLTLAATGCISVKDKEELEHWSPGDWKDALHDNQQRMLIEDQREDKWNLLGLDYAWQKVYYAGEHLYNYITGDTAFKYTKDTLNPAKPDRQREGIFWLVRHDYGRVEPYTKGYGVRAQSTDDWTVRAAAIRALNRSRDKNSTALFLRALEDSNEQVRLEAVKALSNIIEPLSVVPLMKHMANPEESSLVRVACAEALRNHRNAEAAQALVRVLRDKDFGLSWQARKSLKLMTGKDYRYDQSAWLGYLTAANNPFATAQ